VNWASKYTLQRKVWFSARYEPQFEVPNFAANSRAAELIRALGLTGGKQTALTIWNAIPWSWLIDYFLNVGDYMEATLGKLPYQLETITIMVRDEVTEVAYVDSYGGFSSKPRVYGNGFRTIHKSRIPVVAPQARLAFKTNPVAGKLGILGQLAMAPFLKGKYYRTG
jgi:hypothetical protein